MKAILTGLLAGGMLGAVALPAAALPITYTISGTVIDGNDASGLFANGSLKDAPFTATETFDPAMAQSSWIGAGGSSANGNLSVTGLSFASVALTIGGTTKTFSDLTSSLYATAGVQFGTTVQNGTDNLGFNIASGLIKADYTDPNSIGGLVDRYAGYYTMNDASGQQVLWANFEVSAVSAVSAVPLPAAAPLLGMGLLGLAAMGLRRRSSKPAGQIHSA